MADNAGRKPITKEIENIGQRLDLDDSVQVHSSPGHYYYQ